MSQQRTGFRAHPLAAPLLAALALALALTACQSGGAGDDAEPAPEAPAAEPTAVRRGAGGDAGGEGGDDAQTEADEDVAESPSDGEGAVDEEQRITADGVDRPRRTEPVPLGSPEYAIQAFMWWRPEVTEQDLILTREMGFGWVKQLFGWRDIEQSPGEYDWSKTDFLVDTMMRYGGLNLIARLDFQPDWARSGCSDQGPPEDLQAYADFAGAVAERYRGQIAAYQIWNEPNLAREWCDQSPDPAEYAEMLRLAYAAIKAADPSAYVISAGLSPTGSQPPAAMPDDVYLDQLYQAMGGDSEGYFDLLGVHAAGFAAPPEVSPDEAEASAEYGNERFFTFRRVEDLRAIQERYGDGDTRVAILEMGWTSDEVNPDYAWHAVTEAQKADYLVRAYEYAADNWSPWISFMSTIYICNYDWTPQDEEYWWCVTDPDGSPRPAYEALKAMPKVGE